MKKYVVAFNSAFDSGNIEIKFVTATDVLHAVEQAGYVEYVEDFGDLDLYNLEVLKTVFCDQDAAINVLEVT